jgi:3-phenylpropionate/trans-cinnamate dioxygenase ferredoxin reductase component
VTTSADVLVVGAGQAAAELAKALRREKYAGSVRIVGGEQHLPYDRPPLSKGVVKAGMEVERLAFLNAAGYDKLDVEVTVGRRVSELDPSARRVVVDDGEEIHYGVCVMATGARAVPAPWSNTSRVHAIRTFDDARALAGAIEGGATRFLVVGGGYLGLETASTLVDLGREVSLVEASPVLLTGRASAFASGWLEDRHRERGLDLHLGTVVVELAEHATGVRAHLADGSDLEVDFVVFAVGAIANLELAKAAGAECGRGILVDSSCETSLAGLFAIGDVASGVTPSGLEARVESVSNATGQARTLARVLAGQVPKTPGAPTFWSDQVGVSMRLAGWVPPTLETTDVVTKDADGWFVERYLSGGLVAVESVNRLPDYLRAVRGVIDLRTKL